MRFERSSCLPASQTAYAPCSCPDEETCRLRAVMMEVRDAIARILDGTTLDDLVKKRRVAGR